MTGRLPAAVAGAAVLVAAHSDWSRFSSDVLCAKELAKKLNVATRTILDREKELLDLFFRLSQALPWGATVTRRRIREHLQFFFKEDNLARVSMMLGSSLPPAYCELEKAREKRRRLVDELSQYKATWREVSFRILHSRTLQLT